MIKAVIFDLDGVIVKSPFLSDRFQKKFGVPSDEFLVVLKETMAKLRLPKAGEAFTYWKPYLSKWSLSLTEKQFYDFCFSAEKVVPEMIEIAKKFKKKGLGIFILSNNFIERADYFKKNFPLLEEIFDKIYYSWQTGFVKPDPKAYFNLLSDNNLKAKECIYFDDSEENVEVANNLGIKSFLFEDIRSFKKILKENQIL